MCPMSAALNLEGEQCPTTNNTAFYIIFPHPKLRENKASSTSPFQLIFLPIIVSAILNYVTNFIEPIKNPFVYITFWMLKGIFCMI